MEATRQYSSIVYTHIPKCGGTSLRKFFAQAAVQSNLDLDNEVFIPGCHGLENDKNLSQLSEEEITSLKSKKLRLMANHSKYGQISKIGISLSRPYHLTVLRHPVARFISHYNFFYYKLGYEGCANMTLDELPEQQCQKLLNTLANLQTSYLSNIHHKKIVGMTNILKIAKYNLLFEFDHVGIVENIDATVRSLNSVNFDWITFPPSLAVHNASSSEKMEVSDTMIQRIQEANWADLDLYELAVLHLSVID